MSVRGQERDYVFVIAILLLLSVEEAAFDMLDEAIVKPGDLYRVHGAN